ncbi:MAG: xanthine and CO dehydrogenase family maturation factor XdhC/CoxF family protein [Porticoccaceae bacterium]|nr:MAG: xanthine and CO dehydrogenase family maturation factor XdhC/CoxF family protein [Porticoccaceae bacterium]
MIEHSQNSLYALLGALLDGAADEPWVAAWVVAKERSSYRRPGALMLVSPLGRTLGLVSGGCLEADVALRARRALEFGRAEYVVYDSAEEGNIAAELGLGCNGRVGVLVEPVGPVQRRLLACLRQRMAAGEASVLIWRIDPRGGTGALAALADPALAVLEAAEAPPDLAPPADRHELVERDGQLYSLVRILPPVRLLVAGGGIDARPLVAFAAALGWRVAVADHRTIYARPADFPGAEWILRAPPEEAELPPCDAACVMTHNLDLDARWIARLRRVAGLRYLGLLGPVERRREVLARAGIAPGDPWAEGVRGPMGLHIGGELPESVALSTLAECHRELAAVGLL